MIDDYMAAKARRKELIELIATAADEIAEIDADSTNFAGLGLPRERKDPIHRG